MSKSKIVYISSFHKNYWHIYAGTVSDLVDGPFSYVLECGHSWNDRIPRYPKTAKSLVNALNKSVDECRPYSGDRFEISSEMEFLAKGGLLSKMVNGVSETL